jgi:hypothetical protein
MHRLLASIVAALAVVLGVRAAAAGASDTSRYILPPGNFGGLPFTDESLDQLSLRLPDAPSCERDQARHQAAVPARELRADRRCSRGADGPAGTSSRLRRVWDPAPLRSHPRVRRVRRRVDDGPRSRPPRPARSGARYASRKATASFRSGRLPRRPRVLDRRLPTRGGGRYEWRGFLSRREHPHAVGGPGVLLLNWNNRSAPGFMHGDDEPYGSVHRLELFDRFPRPPRLTDDVGIMNRAATEDVRSPVWPIVSRVLRTGRAPSARAPSRSPTCSTTGCAATPRASMPTATGSSMTRARPSWTRPSSRSFGRSWARFSAASSTTWTTCEASTASPRRRM